VRPGRAQPDRGLTGAIILLPSIWSECPLMALSGHQCRLRECPLLGV